MKIHETSRQYRLWGSLRGNLPDSLWDNLWGSLWYSLRNRLWDNLVQPAQTAASKRPSK
jgi:hypothetical protein